ncbi:hypothetical protein U1Q18_052451 [Sarracenia purpurea var. burkii]
MKRKRGSGKRKPKFAPMVVAKEKRKPKSALVVVAKKAFPSIITENTQDALGLDDIANAALDSRVEVETPQNGRNKSRQQADMPETNVSVFANVLKIARSMVSKSSRGFASGSTEPSSDTEQVQDGGTCQKEPNVPYQDPQYKEQELKASLAVIRRVMKMEAAGPFNVPVDPIALRIPDYFDVIDTPMDFGTICSNLENGVKYKNSKDVLRDVQYIWDNCCKYNKKGHYVLKLMKRVERQFTKFWTQAGLYTEQQQEIDESMMKRTKSGPRCHAGPMTDYVSCQQQDQTNPSRTQPPLPTSSYGQPHQPQQQGTCEGQQSSSEPQPSQPLAGMDVGSADSSSTRRRRGRGPTRCLYVWNTTDKIRISTNEFGQPVGPETPKLINFLGTIARNGHMAPLNYVDWRACPDENKEKMWLEVQSKFHIDPKCKSWILKSIGNKWRNWKANLKSSHYSPHETDEERLADRDERVLPDQWRILVSFWNSKEVQERSVINKGIRALQKINHTSGTKSFARVREEQRAKKPDGKEPSRAELFILTRTRKDGQPINEASSVLISQLRERAAQQLGTSQDDAVDDDVFFQVMGQDSRGRVRTYGLGPTPSYLEGPKPSRAEALEMVSEANAEVHEMKERMVAMEQTCAQMASQMATMMSMMMSTMQGTLPDNHLHNVVGSPPEPLHAGRVVDVSANSEGSQQLQRSEMKRGRNTRTGKAARRKR